VYRAIALFLLGTLAVFIVSACGVQIDKSNVTVGDVPSPVAYRLVKHALGETKVPINPQRVVALDSTSLEAAIALEVKLVGATTWTGSGNAGSFPSFFKPEQIASVEYLGDENQPNLEKILALKPDLLLGSTFNGEQIYAQLKQIAPTVMYELYDGQRVMPWQESFELYAEALGKTVEAKKIISNYEQRVARFRQQMGDRLAQTEVSVVRFMPEGVQLLLKSIFVGNILQDVGLPRPPSQNKDKPQERISLEYLPKLGGDVIFVAQSDPEATLYQKVTSNPLWQQLDAVASGKVYEVNYEYWIGGSGAIAANLVVDDLFKYFVARE